MYAAIRRYVIADDSRIDELIRSLNEEFVPQISALPGFQTYLAIQEPDGTLTTVSVFDSEASSQESVQLARDFVGRQDWRDALPTPPQVSAGEVIAAQAKTGAFA